MSRTAIKGDRCVLEATRERVIYLFDNYKNIQLSFSGGKDSTALFYLLKEEAIKRGRRFFVYFLDQEAEYEATIDLVRAVMQEDCVIPLWYQIPLKMASAVSCEDTFLNAWGVGEEWVREKEEIAIKELKEKAPDRFHDFNHWVGEKLAQKGDAVSIIGLRAEESPERRFVMFGEDSSLFWLRKTKSPHKAYPIIDWSYRDIWKFLIENNLSYNRVYDKLYSLGMPLRDMRVSNLIHDRAFKCLSDLQEIEPETFNKLEKRLKGVHCAGIYSNEKMIFSSKRLPSNFKTWADYKNHLIKTLPDDFIAPFLKAWGDKTSTKDEFLSKQMVKNLLIGDYAEPLKDGGSIARQELIRKYEDF